MSRIKRQTYSMGDFGYNTAPVSAMEIDSSFRQEPRLPRRKVHAVQEAAPVAVPTPNVVDSGDIQAVEPPKQAAESTSAKTKTPLVLGALAAFYFLRG